MSSTKQQLLFDQDFINTNIEEWKESADRYRQEAFKKYSKIRSYLSLWQFRLTEDQKCDVREKLAQHLDEITENDFVQDLDSYLEGFCFKLDTSVVPSRKIQIPKEVKIEVAEKQKQPSSMVIDELSSDLNSENNFSAYIDTDDLDYYTLQFFQ